MNSSRKLLVACATFICIGTLPFSASAIPIITEILADPASGLAGDANGDGVRHTYQDEFIELFNPSANTVDLSFWTLSDSTAPRHVFADGTFLASGETITVFGGGSPSGIPGLVYTASSGSLALNNGGDEIVLSNGTTIVDSVTYGAEGGNDEALTRVPVPTGGFVLHSTVPGATSALYSPGTSATGAPYAVTPEPTPPPVVSVPEPGSIGLLLAGMVGLWTTRNKSRSKLHAGLA